MVLLSTLPSIKDARSPAESSRLKSCIAETVRTQESVNREITVIFKCQKVHFMEKAGALPGKFHNFSLRQFSQLLFI